MSLRISLTPDQVVQRLARIGLTVQFTSAELTNLSTTSIVDLEFPVFSFPTPVHNTDLTLRIIKSCSDSAGLSPLKIFEHPWYESESFMSTPCEPGYHTLSMDLLQGSSGQAFNYLSSLKTTRMELPSAVEIVLMLFLHYLGTGEQLFTKKHTWCTDAASLDRQVTVGAFGRNGVFLSGHPANYASRGLGAAVKITLPQTSGKWP